MESNPATTSLSPFLVTHDFGIRVCRLGLASYGKNSITTDDVHSALDQGVNFLNWAGMAESKSRGDVFTTAISSLGARRKNVYVAVQFGARSAADAAIQLRSLLALLRTDYVDLLTLYYIEHESEWEEMIAPGGALQYLQDAKRDGTVRHIGITSHQRKLAAQLAQTGVLDALMIRYNAAHRGAEQDIFPVTQAIKVPVIAYTALRWGALLEPTPTDPPAFSVPIAPEWYRFVLQQTAVAVTLCAPTSRAELDEDLTLLQADGPLSAERYAALKAHGDRVRQHAGTFR